MELVNAISRLFAAENVLHEAAAKGNFKKVEQLIEKGIDVNAYYGACTPLQKSLISHTSEKNNGCVKCAILLLEHGADPNALYKFKNTLPPKKMIQTHVNGGHISPIRLLIMFGATSEGVYFNKAKPEIRNLFLETQQSYQKIKQLEANIEPLQDNDEKKAQYLLEIGKIWETLSQEETMEVYRNYYQEKANRYFELANNLKSNSTVNEKFTDSNHSLRHRFKGDTEPLLAKENQQLSFRK